MKKVILSLCVAFCAASMPVMADAALMAVEAYPDSAVVKENAASYTRDHLIVTGEVKRVRTEYQPESQRFVSGERSTLLLNFPNRPRVGVVAEHYFGRLKALGEVIFSCQARDCGSSNYWANTLFNEAVLYGPERYQSYIIVKTPTGDYHVAYIAQRGTGAVYVYREFFDVPGELETNLDSTSISGIKAKLYRGGTVLLAEKADKKVVALLVELMQDTASLNGELLVTVHVKNRQGVKLNELMQQSDALATQLRESLAAGGVSKAEIQVRSMGPLVPQVFETSGEGRQPDTALRLMLLP